MTTDRTRYSCSTEAWHPQRVWLSLGDQEWVQVDQTIHGRDDVQGFRTPLLLLRVRVAALLDLAGG